MRATPRGRGERMFPGMRERLINRSRQGDLGEASAIECLTRQGCVVWLPLGHSPDDDLIARARWIASLGSK